MDILRVYPPADDSALGRFVFEVKPETRLAAIIDSLVARCRQPSGFDAPGALTARQSVFDWHEIASCDRCTSHYVMQQLSEATHSDSQARLALVAAERFAFRLVFQVPEAPHAPQG